VSVLPEAGPNTVEEWQIKFNERNPRQRVAIEAHGRGSVIIVDNPRVAGKASVEQTGTDGGDGRKDRLIHQKEPSRAKGYRPTSG
jgi:hypothetical protein